ncbi:MAG: DNA mismatch repair endonuclease MutL [Chloroflexi bacterium]|nr:DNA mismatch repair endonuclease MutL [Chloroflexota bacterium]
MPIRLLSQETVARIAAGEVVERPVSVAKELIENALDAGAKQVDVEAQGGGIALLRVADDGSGIAPGELEIAFQRYATSKIESSEDLERIASLGFRGEALSSIAAVADVTLVTRRKEDVGGSFIRVADGEVKERGRRGAPQGTSVTVKHLFRNVPARLKFLKSNAAEAGRISTLVSQYALAYPEVRFSLTIDGRRVFASQGSGDLRDALTRLYGLEAGEAMLAVEHREELGGSELGVRGMVSSPGVTRASRNYITIFVNRRLVQSRTLSYAVLDAYQGLLMTGRYPIAALDLTIDPSETDVNVHPAKMEIKFRDEGIAFAAIHHAVRNALAASGIARPAQGMTPAPVPAPVTNAPAAHTPLSPGAVQPVWRAPAPVKTGAPIAPPAPAAPSVQGELKLPILRVLGQMRETFIVAEGPDGMYLIDQHTAHERVLFDQLRKAKRSGAVKAQGMLQPVTVELTPQQERLLEEQGARIRDYGFQVEPFGERTVLVRGVPEALGALSPARALRDVLDYMESEDLKGYDWEDRLIASVACHGAVRAGKTMTQAEMQEMLRLLEAAENPHSCPHGRPVLLRMTTAQLEKDFCRK